MTTTEILSFISTLIAACSASAAWFAAAQSRRSVQLSLKVAKEASRPYVLATLSNRSRKLDVVIKNWGKTPAHDLKIQTTPDLSIIATTEVGDEMFRPLLTQKFLAPGQELRGLITLTPELIRMESPVPSFAFRVSYEDSSGERYNETYTIDPKEFIFAKSLVRKETNDYLWSISNEIKELRKSMEPR